MIVPPDSVNAILRVPSGPVFWRAPVLLIRAVVPLCTEHLHAAVTQSVTCLSQCVYAGVVLCRQSSIRTDDEDRRYRVNGTDDTC